MVTFRMTKDATENTLESHTGENFAHYAKGLTCVVASPN